MNKKNKPLQVRKEIVQWVSLDACFYFLSLKSLQLLKMLYRDVTDAISVSI